MSRQTNLNNTLSTYSEMTDAERQENFLKFKQFLLTKCRQGSKMYNSIKWASFERVQENNCGLFNRLIIEGEKVTYIVGQSYPEEIAMLKKQFIK